MRLWLEVNKTNDKKLIKKEESFCRYYAALQNPREAAVKAGFTVMPEYRAMCLLSRKSIKARVQELQKENSADESLVSAGFRRLAFGSSADAVKLLLSCGTDSAPDAEALDLFGVSEIKYSFGKSMEIKFFDRLKALERLSELSGAGKDGAGLSIYEALERSAAKTDADGDG